MKGEKFCKENCYVSFLINLKKFMRNLEFKNIQVAINFG